jgi:hypothetical protein
VLFKFLSFRVCSMLQSLVKRISTGMLSVRPHHLLTWFESDQTTSV